MKQLFLKIGTFSMALLVLFSTLSFNVSKHYCAGEIASISYFFQVDGCNMEEEEFPCDEDFDSQQVEKKSCCDTEISFVDGSDFFQKQTSITFSDSNLQLFVFPFKEVFSLGEKLKEKIELKRYSPPLLQIDKVVLYETYLI